MIGRLLQRSETFTGLSLQSMKEWWPESNRASAGVNVTEDVALGSAAWFCAFDLVSNDIGSLGFFTYRKLKPRGRDRATDSPVYRLTHDAPNPYSSAFDFYKLLVLWIMTWGNGYAEIQYKAGRPFALWPIHPSRVKIEKKASGEPYYIVHNDDNSRVRLSYDKMIHVKGFSRDGYCGIGLIGLAREAIGMSVSSLEYGANFFSNNAQPTLLISVPDGTLGDDEASDRLRKAWVSQHGGSKRGGVGFIEDSTKVEKLGLTNVDAQFIETIKYSVILCCQFTHVPPHMLMQMDRATFSNIEHQSIQYVQMALMRYIKAIEQEFTRKLLPDEPDMFCEFNLTTLLRADQKAEADTLHLMRQDGVISVDDWREIKNMNPLPDGLGNIYLNPQNMEPAEATKDKADNPNSQDDSPLEPTEPDADDNNDRSRLNAAFRELAVDALKRLAKIESDKAARAAKKPEAYRQWCDSFLAEHRSRVHADLSPIIAAYREAIGNPALPSMIDKAVDAHIAALRRYVTGADTEAILKIDHAEDVIGVWME